VIVRAHPGRPARAAWWRAAPRIARLGGGGAGGVGAEGEDGAAVRAWFVETHSQPGVPLVVNGGNVERMLLGPPSSPQRSRGDDDGSGGGAAAAESAAAGATAAALPSCLTSLDALRASPLAECRVPLLRFYMNSREW